MTNYLINSALEDKDSRSPLNLKLQKSITSKAKLQHLITTNPLTNNKGKKGSKNNSVSNQKVNLENGSKELFMSQCGQSIENTLFEKSSDAGKSGRPKVGTFMKDRLNKPKTLQISTNYQMPTTQDLPSDFVASSAKNILNLEKSSPQNRIFGNENKFSCANLRSVFPQSVKNSQSKLFEVPSSKNTNPITCSHKLFAQSYVPLDNHRSLSIQATNTVKMLSPQKVKTKEDRAALNELLSNNSKLLEKRRSYYRNRRCNQATETHDDPTSKLSTKAPSQFSEVRRSFPSQKSRSMIKQNTVDNIEDDYKDINSSQKSYYQNIEVKASEAKRLGLTKSKQPSLKDVNCHPILSRKAKSNAIFNFDSLDNQSKDGGSFGNFLKTLYEQRKPEDNEQIETKEEEDGSKSQIQDQKYEAIHEEKHSIDTAHELINAMNTKGEQLDDKEELISSIFSIFNHESQIESRNFGVRSSKESNDKELGFAKTLLVEHLLKESSETSSNNVELGKIISDIIKRSNIEEIKSNPKAKFLLLRKQIQEKRALRNARSFEQTKFVIPEERKIIDNPAPKIEFQEPSKSNTGTETSMKAVDPKTLIGVYQKTKQMLQSYQEKEKDWLQEKEILLTEIQSLQKRVIKNEKFE